MAGFRTSIPLGPEKQRGPAKISPLDLPQPTKIGAFALACPLQLEE
jgi:hypothetical protein